MDRRRRSIVGAGIGALGLALSPPVRAWLPMLDERDATARALEFVPDAARLDPATQPAYRPGSRCTGCFFYQGRASSTSAGCTVFAGWRVPAAGWCREFTPREKA